MDRSSGAITRDLGGKLNPVLIYWASGGAFFKARKQYGLFNEAPHDPGYKTGN